MQRIHGGAVIIEHSSFYPHARMFKWLFALFITVFIAGVCLPRLTAFLRIGRLPGDMRIEWRGREYSFPFATTVLLSLLAGLLLHFLKF